MKPIVNGLEQEFGDRIPFRRVNADKEDGPAIVRAYNILGHPTILLIDDTGQEVQRFVGPQTAETLKTAIETILLTTTDEPPPQMPQSASSDIPPVPTSDVRQVAQGEEVYALYCAACHGAQGEGQPNWKTPLEDGSLPAPPHDSTGHTWHHADGQLKSIIANGNKLIFPQSKMPAFGEQLSDEEITAVIAFIKTFWGTDERNFQWRVTYQTEILPNQ